jgi:transcription termination factor 2
LRIYRTDVLVSYGPKCEQGVWRIRSNLEIQNMYKSRDIVTEIKVRRLEWLGHVIRMEDTRLPKMVFSPKPEGRRGVGRPRLRWLDDIEADIKALGIKRWRIKAQDRKEWSAILREAKAKLKGP